MHMNKLFLALSAASLGGLAQPSPLYMVKAAVPHSRPLRLEGMDYLAARRIILSYGWEPLTGPCEQYRIVNVQVFLKFRPAPAFGRLSVAWSLEG
jgi:hypothetical protein